LASRNPEVVKQCDDARLCGRGASVQLTLENGDTITVNLYADSFLEDDGGSKSYYVRAMVVPQEEH
jgi:hypothetical protein